MKNIRRFDTILKQLTFTPAAARKQTAQTPTAATMAARRLTMKIAQSIERVRNEIERDPWTMPTPHGALRFDQDSTRWVWASGVIGYRDKPYSVELLFEWKGSWKPKDWAILPAGWEKTMGEPPYDDAEKLAKLSVPDSVKQAVLGEAYEHAGRWFRKHDKMLSRKLDRSAAIARLKDVLEGFSDADAIDDVIADLRFLFKRANVAPDLRAKLERIERHHAMLKLHMKSLASRLRKAA
jgi:hypothetical protein